MGVLYWLELLPKARLAFVQPWVTKLLFEPILFYPMFLWSSNWQALPSSSLVPETSKSTENSYWLVKSGTIEPFKYDSQFEWVEGANLDLFWNFIRWGAIKVLSEFNLYVC